jgi:REP element-mobilizing transposase RayT
VRRDGPKVAQQDRSHKRWREANGGAQCGKPARCVRRGGDWKRGTVEWPAGAPVLDPTAQNVERKMRNFLGHKFWARGYFVTTVGRDEEVIRAYIKNQELADQQLEQFELKISAAHNPNNRPNIP